MPTISYRIAPEDFQAGQYLHYKRPLRSYVFVTLWCMLLLAASYYVSIVQDHSIVRFIGGILGLALFLGWVAFYRRFWLPRKWRRIFEQAKSLNGSIAFSWDEKGVTTDTDKSHCLTEWSDIHKWKKNDDYLLLYLTDVNFFIVPQKAFSNREQVSDFEKHIINAKAKYIA